MKIYPIILAFLALSIVGCDYHEVVMQPDASVPAESYLMDDDWECTCTKWCIDTGPGPEPTCCAADCCDPDDWSDCN